MSIADVTIHYLELKRDAFRPKRSARDGLAFTKVDPPVPELNRFLYLAVGGAWFWLDRRTWPYEKWAALLARTDVETWLLSANGTPAGYVEFERRDGGAIEIQYFGLLPSFIGQGLGAHLLTCAVERAFAMGATQVLLNTCSLDHPKALTNYKARGFVEMRSEVRQKEVPAVAPGPWEGEGTARELLRHAVAIVAYRGAKAMRGAPDSFANFAAGPTSRTPIKILAHINDLYDWALTLANDHEKWNNSTPATWNEEIARFHAALKRFDDRLATGGYIDCGAERLLAGPVADSLTHIGQLTMLRRLAGSPVKGESYAKADIVAGRVGPEQTPPKREFD